MNTNTGELFRSIALSPEELKEKLTQVPDYLDEEAMIELNGKDSTMVDMTKDTPLVRWANEHSTNERKKKVKRKIAKKSKQRNRK